MNPQQTFVKLLIIGDSSVGKSCILMRFVQDRFTQSFYNTIGVDFKTKHLMINNKKCKLQIWDTAGQERFRTITANYYKGANGIMLVYDVTNQQSFKNIDYWLQQIQKNGASNVQKILIGNKIDLTSKRVISSQRAQQYSKLHKLNYLQVSASNANNVQLIFQTIVKNILRNKQEENNNKNGKNNNNSNSKDDLYMNSNNRNVNINSSNREKNNRGNNNGCC